MLTATDSVSAVPQWPHLRIRRINPCEKGYVYDSFLVVGRDERGRRIRIQRRNEQDAARVRDNLVAESRAPNRTRKTLSRKSTLVTLSLARTRPGNNPPTTMCKQSQITDSNITPYPVPLGEAFQLLPPTKLIPPNLNGAPPELVAGLTSRIVYELCEFAKKYQPLSQANCAAIWLRPDTGVEVRITNDTQVFLSNANTLGSRLLEHFVVHKWADRQTSYYEVVPDPDGPFFGPIDEAQKEVEVCGRNWEHVHVMGRCPKRAQAVRRAGWNRFRLAPHDGATIRARLLSADYFARIEDKVRDVIVFRMVKSWLDASPFGPGGT